jgi:hypothetical protein
VLIDHWMTPWQALAARIRTTTAKLHETSRGAKLGTIPGYLILVSCYLSAPKLMHLAWQGGATTGPLDSIPHKQHKPEPWFGTELLPRDPSSRFRLRRSGTIPCRKTTSNKFGGCCVDEKLRAEVLSCENIAPAMYASGLATV